jgi:hypothetical protein
MATPDQDYDIAVVLDDNVMAPDFFSKNAAFENDFIAVQGHWTAKTQIIVAILDAISEEINNNIFVKRPPGSWTSSAIIDLEWLLDMTILNRQWQQLRQWWF